MRTLRRISQIFFIVGFFVLFILAAYPLESKTPVDLFLRMSPLNELTAILSSRMWISKSVLALVLLGTTVLFGQFFCGWICPLGTCVDGFDNAVGSKSRNHARSKWLNLTWFKYFLVIAILVPAIFSIQLAGFLDPISLFTRSAVSVLYPLFVFVFEGITDFLFSTKILESVTTKVDTFLHGFLLPVTSSSFRGSLLIGLMFFGILLFAFVQRRFWCRNVCPLGALLGFFSKWRWYRRSVTDDCSSCGLCRKECRTGAIDSDFKSTRHTECISCMDCQAICPTKAVRFSLVKRPEPASVNLVRRKILGAGITGLFALGMVKIGFQNPVRRGMVIRPPGAWNESIFLDRCIRCGECVRICATSGQGLQHAGLEAGLEGLASPVLMPPKGYCEYNCNLCGEVCPTGAIPKLSIEDKQIVKMGTAHFDKTRCIPWYYGDNCMVCEEHCPIPEKAIKFHEEKVRTINGHENTVLLPYVVEEFCVGCGICACRCPVEGEKGIFITNAGEQRRS